MERNVVEFDGGHTAIFEDAALMHEVEEGSVGCVVTSPPYNIYETAQASREHPAPFPVDLAGKAILLGSNEGDMVLDPFMGSGTTLLAAKSHGRIGVGYDVDKSNIPLVTRNMEKIYEPDQWGSLHNWRYEDEEVF